MWTVLWPLLAAASSDPPFARVADAPAQRYYADVQGDGPVTGRWRRRSGPISAWAFADGTLEHYEKWDGKKLVERHQYDAVGRALTTVRYADGAATEVRIEAPDGAIVPVTGWEAHAVPGWEVHLPVGATEADGALTWTDGTRQVRVQRVETTADPFSAEFRDGLATGCGCVLEGHATAWADGHAGSLYQLRVPDPAGDRLGALWTVARDGGALVVATTAPADLVEGTGALGFGRAVLALVRVAEAPK